MAAARRPLDIEIEKFVLSGLIKYPEQWLEHGVFMEERDYEASYLNKNIFRVLKQRREKPEDCDFLYLSNYLKSYPTEGEIDYPTYIYGLEQIPITIKALEGYVSQLKKLSMLRYLYDKEKENANYVCDKATREKSFDEILAQVDSNYGEIVNLYHGNKQPKDICIDLYEKIEEYGNNPKEDIGILTGISTFNKWFCGFVPGQTYLFGARTGVGKSALLTALMDDCSNFVDQTSVYNQKHIPALYLDTEMTSDEVSLRLGSKRTGVPWWYLRSGNWRKNAEMTRKVRENKHLMNLPFNHIFIGGSASTAEVISIIKRWVYKNVGRSQPFLVFYDYIKISGEALSEHNKEYQALGSKFDRFKDLFKDVLPLGAFAAGTQLNRGGITSSRDGADESEGSISGSDKLAWFTSQFSLLMKKTPEELAQQPIDLFGGYKLVTPKASRVIGRDNMHDRMVNLRTGKKDMWKKNWINLDFQSFNFLDKGSGREVESWLRMQEREKETGEVAQSMSKSTFAF